MENDNSHGFIYLPVAGVCLLFLLCAGISLQACLDGAAPKLGSKGARLDRVVRVRGKSFSSLQLGVPIIPGAKPLTERANIQAGETVIEFIVGNSSEKVASYYAFHLKANPSVGRMKRRVVQYAFRKRNKDGSMSYVHIEPRKDNFETLLRITRRQARSPAQPPVPRPRHRRSEKR